MIGVDLFTEALRWVVWLSLALCVVLMILAAVLFEARPKRAIPRKPARIVGPQPCDRCEPVNDAELTAARAEWEKPIRAIHVRDSAGGHAGAAGGGYLACSECFHDWPCPTIKALATFHEMPVEAPPVAADAAYATFLAGYGMGAG